MNRHISKQARFSLVAALLLIGWYLVSCDKKEAPEPPKKESTKEIRECNDRVDPNNHPPHVDEQNRFSYD